MRDCISYKLRRRAGFAKSATWIEVLGLSTGLGYGALVVGPFSLYLQTGPITYCLGFTPGAANISHQLTINSVLNKHSVYFVFVCRTYLKLLAYPDLLIP